MCFFSITAFIGVHNRHGDIAHEAFGPSLGYALATEQYFEKALSYFRYFYFYFFFYPGLFNKLERM